MKQLAKLCLLTLLIAACGGGEKSAAEPEAPEEDEGIELGERPTDRRSAVPELDDDEDDGMEVKGLKGHLDSYDIQKGLQPHSSALSSCFTSNTGKRRYIGGKVNFQFVVTREGTVKSVVIDESDLGSWEIETCLLEIAGSMTFARPRGGEAEFALPLEFSARRRTLWWSEEQADTEVSEKLAELEACQPAPSDVWVTLYVGTRGKVLSVGFASKARQPVPVEWAECAVTAISAWTLSDPRGQIAKASFRYNANN